MTAHLRRPARELLAGACLLVLAACGSTASPVAAPPEDSGEMWDDIVKARPHDVPPRTPAAKDGQWSPTLSEAEQARCKEVAWAAVHTPELWSRYFEYPASADELPLAEDRIRYQVNPADLSVVEVAIPDGGHVGWHPAYIGISVARDTFEVLDMYSSFWF